MTKHSKALWGIPFVVVFLLLQGVSAAQSGAESGLVAFYVDEHNRVLPHSAFRGQTPDEMYYGRGDAVPG